MEVNNINNNISTLNNTPSSLQTGKTQQSNKIENVENASLVLSVNQYNQKRDELSLNIQSINEGLAITKISEKSLEKQQEFLSNIQDKLQKVENNEFEARDKNDIKQEINEDLKNFNEIAYETKFNRQTLLSRDSLDETTTIEVNTSNNNFSIEKPNTPQLANDIFGELNEANLNNLPDLQRVSKQVEEASRQLQAVTSEFTEFGNRLESSAKENIVEQQNLYNQNKANQLKDFGKESTDFNKTNVNANAGYLAASQANIVQEQSVRLLS
ncbi:flagellin [Arcobacter sp. YIC-464]|uniref:flagellin N-terminal helical domain-containing protein n=1 Tax=Arcobacter sp. YIC-464 TaxID=3376631 RepID=UPI003C2058EF